MNIKEVTSTKRRRENKFVDLLLKGLPKVEAAKMVYNIGTKMKGEITLAKLNDSALHLANKKLAELSPENKARMLAVRDKGLNKIEQLMEAKKGIFVMGRKVDEENDNAVQLGAARTALEFTVQKPTEKKEITHRSFFDACVRTIETDEDGNIIDGEIIDE